MKKFKLSWQHFLMSILVILVLGALVYYLEQNKVLEGMRDNRASITPANDDKKKTTGSGAMLKGKNAKNKKPEMKNNPISKAISTNATRGSGEGQSAVEAKSKIQEHFTTKKSEGFTNLNYAPVSASGPKASCPDPLKPYQNYKCGPTNVNNFFGGMEFKPECCGNPAGSFYSNSVGCACICPEQWTYLNSRGGNRSFPTEF
jgi:hypothetical protein